MDGNVQKTRAKKSAAVVVSRQRREKDQTDNGHKLDPNYVVGFIDGEGSFSVSISKHSTTKRRLDVRAEFEMELREDDREILERIQQTIGCGYVYRLVYKRYDWQPHAKYKVASIKELTEVLIPFLDAHPLQAKKKLVYELFRKIVFLIKDKKHLSDRGFKEILKLRDRIRAYSKKYYRNR
ncbi:MAG: LAGLIDADG family homing endonuclease [Patescibacteria group bacterium]|nr:LAGLIDADG family homing endonuclease [Patescibacteria group bacterium]